jgi:DNA ligase-1
MSRKFDGTRIIAIVDDEGDVLFFTRQKTQIFTLDVVKAQIQKVGLRSCVLDGEICKMENGLEKFQALMKELRKDNHTIQNPKYLIFDMLTLDEFNSGSGNRLYGQRYLNLLKVITPKEEPVLSVVEQRKMKKLSDAEEYMSIAVQSGWEGLIIRKDVRYEAKRSKNMLKMKKFIDEEFKIVGYALNDDTSVIIDGVDTRTTTLGSVYIMLEGKYKVSVGSGFDKEERLEFAKNPKSLIGKVITVKHFGVTTDQNGKRSLRFPTFKCFHGKQRVT